MGEYQTLTSKMNDQLLEIYEYKLELWQNFVLNSWQFWFGVALTVLPVILWLYLHDNKKTGTFLLAGLTTAILSALLDTSGNFLGWYDYQYDVFPIAPNYIPWDFVFIPVLTMFTLQFFTKFNILLRGAILSAFIAFIGLPLLSSMGIYVLLNWNYFFSFVTMFIIFLLSYLVSKAGHLG